MHRGTGSELLSHAYLVGALSSYEHGMPTTVESRIPNARVPFIVCIEGTLNFLYSIGYFSI